MARLTPTKTKDVEKGEMRRRSVVSVPSSSASDVAEYQKHATPEQNKSLLRSIDWHIMPLLFGTCIFIVMDKVILSSAAVFHLREDTGLVGSQFSWVSSVFYFGYLLWTYPASILIARVPVAKFIGGATLFWGLTVALHAVCTNFAGLVTVRFFLGIGEASIPPAMTFITTSWYTRDETPTRTGLWFAGYTTGGLCSSLLAYGIGQLQNSAVAPWRLMYIILGILTFLWGFVLYFFLPDSISKAKFLTAEQRIWATDRVIIAGCGQTEHTKWAWDQTIECLRDPKTWFTCAISCSIMIPMGGLTTFSNVFLTSFGFTPVQTTLISIPHSIIGTICIAGTGYLAGRFRSLNCILLITLIMPGIIGSVIIMKRDEVSTGVGLFGFYMLATGPTALPLLLSLVQANYSGVTKKMTMTSGLFLVYCAGAMSGPQLFLASEAPSYPTAWTAILVCFSLAACLALGLRFYLQWFNAYRTKKEGIEGSCSAAGAVGGGIVGDENCTDIDLKPEDYEDVTDWNKLGFRYRL